MSEKQPDLFEEREENEWECRQREKAGWYDEKATKTKAAASAAIERVHKLRDTIPFGEPIHIGHYSEQRDRNFRDKLNRKEDAAWAENNKANHYTEKAARIEKNLETNAVISSDDPDAVTKLEQKLAGMQEQREKIKAYNKAARAKGEDQTPKYILQNLGGNIRSVKKRIDDLKARAQLQDSEKEIAGIVVKQNTADNRIQLFFPGKPVEEVRANLRSHGFIWSGRGGCWQRQLNGSGIFAAEQVCRWLEKRGEGNE